MSYLRLNELFDASFDRLRGPGNGCHHNVDGRVYQTEFEEIPADMVLPVVCLPAVREDGKFLEGENSTAQNPSWLRRAHAYLPERSSDSLHPTSTRDCRFMLLDLEHVVTTNPALLDALSRCAGAVRMVGWDIDSGWPMQGRQVGKVEAVFELSFWTGPEISEEL